jgi:hypothetical protein
MRMLVSRNALALIRLVSIEAETSRQGTPQGAQPLDRRLPTVITFDLEPPLPGDTNFHVIAFLQSQRIDDGAWNSNREAVAPA